MPKVKRPSNKVFHNFNQGEPTVNKFRDVIGEEWLDNVERGKKIYVRKHDVGCWRIVSIVNEDSGVYIEAGEDTNPQSDDVQIMEEHERDHQDS